MATAVADELIEVEERQRARDLQPPGGTRRAPRSGAGWRNRFRRATSHPEAVAVTALLALTAFCYLFALDRQGWANAFYAAAVEAGTKSWKAFFFGSFDSSNFITVDKPPASLWVMELSARIFGLNSWSLLVPQALEGVATVALLWRVVRRWFGWRAGVLAGAVLALTPVAALMFRYNNPDSLLVLLLLAATWATQRAIEDGRTRWLLLAGAFVGTGFITKMLQAFVVLPALCLAYLWCGPHGLGRRIRQLLAGGLALLVAAGWWVAAVQLTPAGDRPYVGGSTDNSELNLIFGYNGFGRLTGNEAGSVTGGGAAASGSPWGPTGLDRMFLSTFGGQISWLLPAALALIVVGCVIAWRRPRNDHLRAAVVLFGGSLLVTDAVFSFGQGIIHPYYSVALAPAIAAIVAIGATLCWRSRRVLAARLLAAALLAGSAAWSFVLLDRSPGWYPWLRIAVLGLGGATAVAILGWQLLARWAQVSVAAAALAVALAGPLAYTLETIGSVENGSIPSAGPALTGSFGPGGFGGGRGGFGGGAGGFGGGRGGQAGFGGGPGAGSGPGSGAGSFSPPAGAKAAAPAGAGSATGRAFAPPSGAGRRPGSSGVGGLLDASKPGAAIVRLLEGSANRYTWAAAIVGANSAAGYQLATDDPVMAIGGFNGTDPAPTLSEFEADVAKHEIHWFIAGGGGVGPGGGSASSTDVASQITSWVESHFTSKTVDGVTLYDLSGSAAG